MLIDKPVSVCFQHIASHVQLRPAANALVGSGAMSIRPGRCPPRLYMSVSTPSPPPPARWQPPPGWDGPVPGLVTEMHSPEMLRAVLASLADETSSTMDATGTLRERPILVVLEAYSKACRACIGVRRAFEKCAVAHRASVRCLKFDAAEVSTLADSLGVRSLPTFILYKNGVRFDHFSTSCRETLEEHIVDNL